MTSIRQASSRSLVSAPSSTEPASTSVARPFSAPEEVAQLPRSLKAPAAGPDPSKPVGFVQRTMALFRQHDRAVAAVLTGASAIGGLVAPQAAQAATPVQPTTEAPPTTERVSDELARDLLFGGANDTLRVTPNDSPLNEKGSSHASGRGLFDVLRPSSVGNDRERPIGTDNGLPDPDSVLLRNNPAVTSAEVRDLVLNRVGAPKTAEVVAAKLAELYGPFTASNSAENRRAIISNLLWIGDTSTGIKYDTPRAGSSDATTQSPNHTLSTRSGVCRDIHTALSAILASLMNAHQQGGKWVPGSPTGQESNVQTLGFANPTEYHAYMTYRDPGTGRWNALEYGKHYDLQARTSPEAFQALPGYMSGYHTYRITGWDSKPVVSELHTAGAAAARNFFRADPGVGKAGEVRLEGRATGATVTGFITPKLAVTGAIDESAAGSGIDGGVKINYHNDFETLDKSGYVRVAGGMYSSGFEASRYTGLRGEKDRAAYRTYVLGIQVDGRVDGKPHALIGEHLKAKWGLDGDLMFGLPLATGPGADPIVWGAVPDFSNATLGAEGTLFGHERLRSDLSLDWALRARYDLDAIKVAHELMTSEGSSARSLGKDALATDFAVALTHKSSGGITTRFEAGGTQYLATPLDPQVTATGNHRALLTVTPASGLVSFGVLARGESIDGRFVPVSSLGVALDLNPSKNVNIGVGVDGQFRDGDISRIGESINATARITVRF
ncbi:MAG: hypothetical protein HY791_36745 [Deltaproteobacteria bacterium]|nr:hypothetical protein [Deltaproteobacteria bacterium]